jgi:hypothetical protein
MGLRVNISKRKFYGCSADYDYTDRNSIECFNAQYRVLNVLIVLGYTVTVFYLIWYLAL